MRHFIKSINFIFFLFVPIIGQSLITGDLNSDNLTDTLIYSKPNDNNEVQFKITLSSYMPQKPSVIKFNYQLSEEHLSVSIPMKGCIRVFESGLTGESIKYYYYYQFNLEFQNWFLIKQIEYNSNISSGNFTNPIINIEYTNGTNGIDGTKISIEQATKMSKDDRVQQFQIELNVMHDTLLYIYNSKSFNKIPKEYFDNIRIAELLENIEVTSENVEMFNNIAFVLGLSSKGLYNSILILKNVISVVPSRTVAYLNLADAYWEINEKALAKEAYKTYVNLMIKDGKEKKIPAQVYERIK